MIIYGLKENDKFFYVGKTKNIDNRILGHSYDKRPSFKRDKIYELIAKGKTIEYDILIECEEDSAAVWERYFITKLISEGHELTNVWLSGKNNGVILQLLADDLQPKEIAAKIHLSHRTIETKIQQIKAMFGCKTLGGLMYKCYKLGIVK